VAVGSASLILVSLLLVALLGESRLAPRLEPPTFSDPAAVDASKAAGQ